MKRIDLLIKDIKELFDKQPNTVYEVRVVDEMYSKNIHIYFEWAKIGRVTHSQEIAKLDGSYTEHTPEIIERIRKETGLTVTARTNIYA